MLLTLIAGLQRFMPLLVAVCTVLMGGFFMARTAPGHVPDIWAHVYRVDGMLNGDLLARPVESRSYLQNVDHGAVGGRVDQIWIDYSWQDYDGYDPAIVLPDTITVRYDGSDGLPPGADVPYNNAAVNSPVAYAPQLAAFAIGRASRMAAGATYYLAEAAMLLVYAVCMGVAVAALPRWRIAVGLVLLCPLLLRRNAFAISGDSLTMAVNILFACLLFRAVTRRVSVAWCAGLAVTGVVLAMCKFTYAPLVVLTLLVPWVQRRLADRGTVGGRDAVPWRAQLAVLGGGTAAAVAWVLVWMKAVGWFTTTPLMVSYETMVARKHALLTDPVTMARAAGAVVSAIATGQSNLDRAGDTLLIRCIWAAIAVMVLLLAIATVSRALPTFETVFWWIACVVSLGCVLLTYVALWLQYTPDGRMGVMGFQYRYFLPFAALWALCALQSLGALWSGRLGARRHRGRA